MIERNPLQSAYSHQGYPLSPKGKSFAKPSALVAEDSTESTKSSRSGSEVSEHFSDDQNLNNIKGLMSGCIEMPDTRKNLESNPAFYPQGQPQIGVCFSVPVPVHAEFNQYNYPYVGQCQSYLPLSQF
jgi:hypothetical protein